MTDLNQILTDVQSALDIETDPKVAVLLNRAATSLAYAIQIKEFAQKSVDITALGIPDERNAGRRSTDVK